MDTVRGMMAQLKAEEVTLDDVIENFRARPWQPLVRQNGLSEAYRRAEEMPDDDDVFWIDVAYTRRLIKYDAYRQLVDALAANKLNDQSYAESEADAPRWGTPFANAAGALHRLMPGRKF